MGAMAIGMALLALLAGLVFFAWLLATGMREAFTDPDEDPRGAVAIAPDARTA